jgi:predicted O-methyltransferase YrrM
VPAVLQPGDIWASVEAEIGALLLPTDPVLERAREASLAAGMPDHGVSPSEGMLLWLLARSHRARAILELGTLGGYSTIWLARALAAGGRLLSLELDPDRAQLARENVAAAGLAERVEVRAGDALAALDDLLATGSERFDFVFLDADKERNPEYLERILELTGPGALIVADNVIRGGAVFDPEVEDPIMPASELAGLRRFFELLASDPRIHAVAIQTVGSKGHDGFAIALTAEAPG